MEMGVLFASLARTAALMPRVVTVLSRIRWTRSIGRSIKGKVSILDSRSCKLEADILMCLYIVNIKSCLVDR